jgi:hypothetical protein
MVDAPKLLQHGIECHGQGRLDEAVAAYVAVIRLLPDVDETYLLLHQIHRQRGEIDAAWCVASILFARGLLDESTVGFYEAHVPRRLAPRRAPLDVAAWMLLRDPREDPNLTASLGARAAGSGLAMDARGIDPAALGWAATALGVGPVVAPHPQKPLEAGADLDEVHELFMLRERLFFAGREATAWVAPHYILGRASVWNAKHALGVETPPEYPAWHRAIRMTRMRAGALACSEPALAYRLLAAEGATDELAELCAFAVSPEHHRLRAILGVAVEAAVPVPLPAPAPVPPPPAPAVVAASPRIRVAAGVAVAELRALLERANDHEPTTSDLRLYFDAKKVRAVTKAGRTLTHPPWATIVRGAESVFLEMDSDAPARLVGVQLAEDDSHVVVELSFANTVLGDFASALETFETHAPLHAATSRTRGCEALRVDLAIGRRVVVLVAEHRSDILERVEVSFEKNVRRDAPPPKPVAAPPARKPAEPPPDAFARVLANPGSLAARQALLADWTTKNDPRAEMLAQGLAYAEHERAGTAHEAAAVALKRTMNVAVAKHGNAWAGDLADLVDEFAFHRGLVASVKLSGLDFVARARRLFACAPIQQLRLHAPMPVPAKLFAVPWFSQLVSLEISGVGAAFGDEGALALAKCVRARNLRWVALTHCGISDPGVENLAASPHLEQVQYLCLRGNPADTTPSVLSDEGFYTASRPALAAELEKLAGPRPWLSLPEDPARWPPYSESFEVNVT